ncbi:MAG: DNA-binding response regulator, partial [Anaerolineales bacterium]|nr:DNA-binding response regulator [Anaerolineales bacterium]
MQTILVVDDEPQIVKVMRGYLEQAGYRVVAAGDGPGALAQY